MDIVMMNYTECVHDRHQTREEPDEVKVSSPVLKSSGGRRLPRLRLTGK